MPQTEVGGHLLRPSDTRRSCPVKGEARYHSVVIGDRIATDAVWSHPDPPPSARWLRGYHGIAFDTMDVWLDEAEQVHGHLRDPYHRVDTRATDRRVRVTLGNRVLAESDRAVLLSETGLPTRLYIPADDVRADALAASPTSTVCPYKGTAEYAHAAADTTDGTDAVTDAAWR